MAKHIVKCLYCGKNFDANEELFVKVGRRYAHTTCAEEYEAIKTKEEKDKEELEKYILNLLKEEKISVKVRRQIKTYIEENNYTYSGILKALIYFYEIKGNPIDKANGGIGIVPYVYNDAFNYYYELWLANQKNEHKLIEQYVPQIEEVRIPVPQRKEKRRKLFSFLDSEGDE